jgi:hypothetical protein
MSRTAASMTARCTALFIGFDFGHHHAMMVPVQ